GAAVVLTDDDILSHVNESTRQVARVGRAQRRVSETLTRTVGGDEVLGDREALAVARDDRTRDDLTLRVRHQTTHTGDLSNLHPVTTSTRGDHAVDVVVGGKVVFHRASNLSGRLVPDLDELLATLGVGREALLVLGLNLRGELLVAHDDLALVRRREHIGGRNGHP